jgi:predicted metal-dependent HD superfamily phosphohydrolase
MEQNSEPGKINITGATYQLIKNDFHCTYRGKVSAKNKGEIDMYFVNSMNFPKMESFIRTKLKNELAENLYYHSIHHIEDVLNAASNLARQEDTSDYDTLLLKTAVLYHDSGFTINAKDHEETGCNLARKTLPEFGYTKEEIEKICGMIMATKIPQSPKNKMEEIICDADLDYLGRDDYDPVSSKFYKEINQNGLMNEKEWLKLQVKFLEEHRFFTDSAIRMRKQKKQEHLQILKKKLEKI